MKYIVTKAMACLLIENDVDVSWLLVPGDIFEVIRIESNIVYISHKEAKFKVHEKDFTGNYRLFIEKEK